MSSFRLRKINQRIKLHIIEHRDTLIKILRFFSLAISIIAITAIIYFHGFEVSIEFKNILRIIVHTSLIFYTLKYILNLLYTVNRKEYIKDTLVEFIIIIFLIVNWILIFFSDITIPFLNFEHFEDFYLLFIQFYFLIMVIIEISKASKFLTNFQLSPPLLMITSFLLLIVIGTVLLSLPRMRVHPVSFIDTLFTSTSACCVTGLTVVDIGSTFTFKGHVILLILIQIGGLSILSFATFFTTFLARKSTGLRYQHLVKDLLSTNKLSDSFQLLRSIFIMTFIIETLGVVILYFYWKSSGTFDSGSNTFFYALFHTVSAFNNAGISLWDANLMDNAIVNSYFPQGILVLLVLLGGIGFVTLSDFFSPKSIRERRKYSWKRLLPATRIILYTTFGIIFFATIVAFVLEYNNTLTHHHTFFEKLGTILLQTISGRTAGFNMIDISQFALPTMIIFMIIMFIGASPGSTGGGIKTTTFFVLLKTMFATIRGKKNIEFQKKTIPFQLVNKAYSIILMSLFIVLSSIFALSILEPHIDLTYLLFDSISAFSTCGLSSGACSMMGTGGKIVLILNMYIGRVGTLTLAFALSKRIKETKHQYPEIHFMIG